MSVGARAGGARADAHPTPDTAAADQRPSHRLSLGLVAALGALTAVVRLPGFVTGAPFNADETTLATGGRTLADGGRLYVDVIDRKPPLPFAAYALLDGHDVGHGLAVMRLVVAVLIFAAALVVAHEADRRAGGRAAVVAGVIVVAGSAALGPGDAQAANFELFALLPVAVAFVAASRGHAVTAGAALAVATLCKQPAAATAIPVAVCLWRVGRWRSLGIAAGAGLAATLALAAPFGIGRVVDWALLGAGGYLSLSPGDLAFTGVRLLATLGLLIAFWGGSLLLALASGRRAPAASDPHDRNPSDGDGDGDSDGDRAGDRDLWWFLGASALGVVVGFRFFPHYLIQLLPALALLAARGAVRRPAWLRPASAWLAVSTAVAVGLALAPVSHAVPAVQRSVAGLIRDYSCPGDRVLVWGNLPELYWRAERIPTGGFTHTEFLTGYSGGRRHSLASEAETPDRRLYDEWLTRVRRQLPPVIVDTAPADLRGGRWFPLRRFGAVQRLVDQQYRRVATVERVRVYVRTGSDGGEGDRPAAGGCR